MEFRLRYVDGLISKDEAVWMAEVLDDEGYLVCEVWNNGDNGGNFYVWHNGTARYGIEAQAIEDYPDSDAPMDDWIANLGTQRKTTS